jgi:nucleoside-diphosphate-sugar epimerase
MRVAVTGAAGFVGSAVVRRLRENGHDVHAFDLRGGGGITAWDIAGGPLPQAPKVDGVIHVAAYVSDTGPVALARRVNVKGTEHVVQSFPRARFVHVSTCSVYDPHRPQHLARESEAPAARSIRWTNAYGRTKAEAERLLSNARPDAVVLRPHAVYGPGDTTLQPRLREAAARRGWFPLPGPGDQRHSVTSVTNLVDACLLGLAPGAPAGVYNVSDPEPVRIADALALLAAPAGAGPVTVRPLPELPLQVLATVVEGGFALAGRLRGRVVVPPISRYTVEHLAKERTFDITAARERLGYAPAPSVLDQAPTW